MDDFAGPRSTNHIEDWICTRDRLFQGTGREHVDIELQQFLVGQAIGGGETSHRVAVLTGIGQDVTGLQAIGVVDTSPHIGDSHDAAALVLKQVRRGRTHLAKALHSHRRPLH